MTHGTGEERQARLESSDDLVQALVLAKYALAAGDPARATDAIDRALTLARRALSASLAGSEGGGPAAAGDLVRSQPPPPLEQ